VPFVSAAASPAGAGDATAPSGIAGGSAVQPAKAARIKPNRKRLATGKRVDISGFLSTNIQNSHRPRLIVRAGRSVTRTLRQRREFPVMAGRNTAGRDTCRQHNAVVSVRL
jgi:hypothetical protein